MGRGYERYKVKTGEPNTVIVANSIGAAINRDPNTGLLRAELSPGGLTSAVGALAETMPNPPTWIGSPRGELNRDVRRAINEYSRKVGYDIIPIDISDEVYDGFYNGYANGVLWFALHSKPEMNPQVNMDTRTKNWRRYVEANQMYAKQVADNTDESDLIWVHDYQLMRVPHELRQFRPNQKIIYFHHIPFPDPRNFRKGITYDNERTEILSSLLNNNLAGFQTPQDVKNFIDCCKVEFGDNLQIDSQGDRFVLTIRGHKTVVGAYPISIDPNDLSGELNNPDNAETVRMFQNRLLRMSNGRAILASVHRADPMKATLDRFAAFEDFIRIFPKLGKEVLLVEVSPRSRKGSPTYDGYFGAVGQAAERINDFATNKLGFEQEPIWLYSEVMKRPEVAALYSVAILGLATTDRDGMNLQPAEQTMVAPRGTTVLVGKDVGAAQQYAHFDGGAIRVVDPKDRLTVAHTMAEAIEPHIRNMKQATPLPEKMLRDHRDLRQFIRNNDVTRWGQTILNDARAL